MRASVLSAATVAALVGYAASVAILLAAASQAQALFTRMWSSGFLPTKYSGVALRGQGDPGGHGQAVAKGAPLGRVDHALLAEPAVSMALRKTRSFPVSVIAPELHRSVDLQQEWGRLFKQQARLPQAGITVLGKAMNDPALQARVMAAYEKSVLWCQKNALQCGEMVARRIDLLTPEAVADSLAASPLKHVSAAAARDELTLFFQQMHAKNPALVGGKLPDAGFYGNPGQP